MDLGRQLEELEVSLLLNCSQLATVVAADSTCSTIQHLLLPSVQALRSMYPEEEGCFLMAPAEHQAWAAAAAAEAGAALSHANLSGSIR